MPRAVGPSGWRSRRCRPHPRADFRRHTPFACSELTVLLGFFSSGISVKGNFWPEGLGVFKVFIPHCQVAFQIAPIPSGTLGTCLASSRSSALIALLNSSALRSMRNDFSLVYSVFVWFLTSGYFVRCSLASVLFWVCDWSSSGWGHGPPVCSLFPARPGETLPGCGRAGDVAGPRR